MIFPTNDLRAQASYSLAQAYFQAGSETTRSGSSPISLRNSRRTNSRRRRSGGWPTTFSARRFRERRKKYKLIFQNTTGWVPRWRTDQSVLSGADDGGRAAVADWTTTARSVITS